MFECQDVKASGEAPSSNCKTEFSPGTSAVGEQWFLESTYLAECDRLLAVRNQPAESNCLLWADKGGEFVLLSAAKNPASDQYKEFFGNVESCLADVNGEAVSDGVSIPCTEFLDQQTEAGQPGDPYNICGVSVSPLSFVRGPDSF